MMIEPQTKFPPVRQRTPETSRKPQLGSISEVAVWHAFQGGWKQLCGGFYQQGFSIEWHDFELAVAFEWARSFHPGSLELCLNLSGEGSVKCGKDVVNFGAQTAGFYVLGRGALQATRAAGLRHRFLTVEFSIGYVREQLGACDGSLDPLVERLVREGSKPAGLGEVRRLTTANEQLVAQLLHPPVPQGAEPLWCRGKVLQLMAEFFFCRRGDGEFICDRQKRLARERVDRVVAILRQHLAEPPNLEAIGREVGCSPFYLSRTFSAEMGMTIPQYLRKIRMERAAELLRSGKHNVTEAALEVGYSSLSHFSQAFCQIMGCCPGLYPLKAE
jgi:AraC family transcriptional regulator